MNNKTTFYAHSNVITHNHDFQTMEYMAHNVNVNYTSTGRYTLEIATSILNTQENTLYKITVEAVTNNNEIKKVKMFEVLNNTSMEIANGARATLNKED